MADTFEKPAERRAQSKRAGVAIPAVAAAVMFARRPTHAAPTWPPVKMTKPGAADPWPSAPGMSRSEVKRST